MGRKDDVKLCIVSATAVNSRRLPLLAAIRRSASLHTPPPCPHLLQAGSMTPTACLSAGDCTTFSFRCEEVALLTMLHVHDCVLHPSMCKSR